MMELMNFVLEFAGLFLLFGATFVWTGQSTATPTNDQTITDGTRKLSFYGAAFNDPIQITTGANLSTHVEDFSNVEQCTVNHISNTERTDGTHVKIQGGSEVLLNTLLTTECPLKINFSHGSSVVTTAATFFCYDGTTPATAPTDVNVYACEQTDASWTAVGGSANTLALDDNTTATSHDFFIALSVLLTAVGIKTAFKMKFQLTYA